VLVVPYPVPIREQPCSYSLLKQDEHRFLNRFVQQLNGVIRQSARDAGFYFLDAMPNAFTDRSMRICDGPQDAIGLNFVALKSIHGSVDQVLLPSNWIHNSLHPNERGHAVMAEVVEEWLRTHPDPAPRPDPKDAAQPFTPASLQELMGPGQTSYCGGPEPPSYCDRDDGAWTVTQAALVLRDAALPALLLVAGSWLVWLRILAGSRERLTQFRDKVAQWVLRRFGDQRAG
jgi:hypothetical protein